MVGRGTRLAEGKDHLLLLDFLWLTERHDLCRPSALVCKSRDVAAMLDKKMADNCNQSFDLIKEEEAAETDITELHMGSKEAFCRRQGHGPVRRDACGDRRQGRREGPRLHPHGDGRDGRFLRGRAGWRGPDDSRAGAERNALYCARRQHGTGVCRVRTRIDGT